MKIFLTEYEVDNTIYAGINIFAESIEEAEYIADLNDLVIVGEIVSVKFKPEFDNDYLGSIKPNIEKRVIH
tara:strand:- start:9968 stop:10180 length:213 start_codon:yes stop_codon:yes gene_type:complete